MIQKVIISGLKNIKHEEMTLKPLTLLTGLNSTGKSSVLQAILLVNKATTKNGQIYLDHILSSFPYNPQIQISAESETKRSIFREKDKTKRSKKESAQHSKSRNKSFVMTSVSAL